MFFGPYYKIQDVSTRRDQYKRPKAWITGISELAVN